MNGLPLEGMRVIEMGQIVAGPTAGLIMADMGADVIKIESGTGDPAIAEGLDQSRLIHHGTARGVDQKGRRLHQAETPGVEQPARLGRQRRVNRDDVGLSEQIVEAPPLGPGLGRRIALGVGERVRAACHRESVRRAARLYAEEVRHGRLHARCRQRRYCRIVDSSLTTRDRSRERLRMDQQAFDGRPGESSGLIDELQMEPLPGRHEQRERVVGPLTGGHRTHRKIPHRALGDGLAEALHDRYGDRVEVFTAFNFCDGYLPEQVDEVYITNLHPDHVGGLLADGRTRKSGSRQDT